MPLFSGEYTNTNRPLGEFFFFFFITFSCSAGAISIKSGTVIGHPQPYTLHPAPYTLHPTSYTLHPTCYTLHPTPKAHTQTHTLNPTLVLHGASET
jgi:hypothetical protein